MGMFDRVDFEMKCPVCNNKVENFQTKGMGKMMLKFKVSDLPINVSFYSQCNNCKLWIELQKQ